MTHSPSPSPPALHPEKIPLPVCLQKPAEEGGGKPAVLRGRGQPEEPEQQGESNPAQGGLIDAAGRAITGTDPLCISPRSS